MPAGSYFSKLSTTIKGSNRMLLVIGVAVVLALAVAFFGRGGPVVPTSVLKGAASNQQTVQAKVPVTPVYDENLVKSDKEREEKAKETGGSALPTVKIVDTLDVDLGKEKRKAAPDLDTLPRPAPPTMARPTLGLPPSPTMAPPPIRVADTHSENYSAPIRSALVDLGKITYPAAKVEFLSKETTPVTAASAAAIQAQAVTGTPKSSRQMLGSIPLPLAGTIIYAELVGEANSDAPGPVLARILQGPLEGATLIGAFTPQRETLVLRFTTISLGTSAEGEDIQQTLPISAVAVDQNTLSPGIATDVDHHFLINVAMVAASSFASGFASVVTQSGQSALTSTTGTQIINPTRSVGQELAIAGATAGAAGGQALANTYGNRPVTIKIAAGTPIGVLFMPTGGN